MADGGSPTRWVKGEVLVSGTPAGRLLVLTEPLSFWGGVAHDGTIVDRHHPQAGANLAGTALFLPGARGSSSSTSTLLECIRRKTAPSVLLLLDGDPILVIAAVAAQELYGRTPTVVRLTGTAPLESVSAGDLVRVDAEGQVWVT